MLCSMSTSPALPRTCHRDVNLSLAHTLNILLAPGSEEGFISRGFLHSSFFNCLSGTLGLLPLWGKWFLWKCFYPNGDEISHVLSITSVPWWIWISLEWRIWCQTQQCFQSRSWERTTQLLWSNTLELLPKPGIFFKGWRNHSFWMHFSSTHHF